MHDEQKNINPWADKLNDLPIPDMQDAWNGMEATLNSELPVKQQKDWRRWLILLILLLLLIGVCNCPGYLRMGRQTSKKDSTQKQNSNPGGGTAATNSNTKDNDQSGGGTSFLPGDANDNKPLNEQADEKLDQHADETKQTDDAIKSDNENATSGRTKQNTIGENGASSKTNKTTGKKPTANIAVENYKTVNDINSSTKNKNNKGSIPVKDKNGAGLLSTRSSNGSKNKKSIANNKRAVISAKKSQRNTKSDDNNIAIVDSAQKDDSNIVEKIPNVDSTVQTTAIDTAAKKDSAITSTKPAPVDSAIAKKKKAKDSTSEKGFAIAVGLNHIFPIGDQQSSNFNSSGTTGSWKDYIPVPQVRYHFNKKLYVQIEAQFNAPQYTKSLLAKQKTSTDTMPGVPRQQSSVTIKKLFYLNIPLSVHYSPVKNLYLGTGLQYSRLSNAVGLLEDKSIRAGAPDTLQSSKTQSIKSDSTYQLLTTSEWRLLFDANYHWRKFIIGVRYNYALSNFINVQVSSTQLTQARNSSLQFYLRYTLWDQRRKKSKTTK